MIYGLFVLFVSQLVGEVVARWLGLALPGPAIGIPILLVWLFVLSRLRRVGHNRDDILDEGAIGKAADGLIAYLGLFFVPAGVGVVQHVDLILANGVALVVALIGSAALTLVVTVLTYRLAARLLPEEPK